MVTDTKRQIVRYTRSHFDGRFSCHGQNQFDQNVTRPHRLLSKRNVRPPFSERCSKEWSSAGRPTPHCGIGASSARARAASWPLGGAQRQHRSEYRAGRSQALRKRMARRRRPEECVLRGDEALRHGDGRSSTCRSTGFDLATPAAITLAACAQVRCLCPSLLVPARPTPRSPRLPYQ